MKLVLVAVFGALALSAQSNAPIIVGADGRYLGRLSADPYAADSVSNPWGKYGNPWSSDSINNTWGKYGNPWSSYSTGGTVTVRPSPSSGWNMPAASDTDYSFLSRGWRPAPSSSPVYYQVAPAPRRPKNKKPEKRVFPRDSSWRWTDLP